MNQLWASIDFKNVNSAKYENCAKSNISEAMNQIATQNQLN